MTSQDFFFFSKNSHILHVHINIYIYVKKTIETKVVIAACNSFVVVAFCFVLFLVKSNSLVVLFSVVPGVEPHFSPTLGNRM